MNLLSAEEKCNKNLKSNYNFHHNIPFLDEAILNWNGKYLQESASVPHKFMPPSMSKTFNLFQRLGNENKLAVSGKLILEKVEEIERNIQPNSNKTIWHVYEEIVESVREDVYKGTRVQDAIKKNVEKSIKSANRSMKLSGIQDMQIMKVDKYMESYFERVNWMQENFGSKFLNDKAIKMGGFNYFAINAFGLLAEKEATNRGTLKAIDAISLLHPITDSAFDSGMDDQVRQMIEKSKKILAGEIQNPSNEFEAISFYLAGNLLKEYPPQKDPIVTHLLKKLLYIQVKSSQLQKAIKNVTEKEILETTFTKGGLTGVLFAYVGMGKLTDEEIEFFYKWGALNQLLDDLIDLEKDLSEKAVTLWTEAYKNSDFSRAFKLMMNLQRIMEEEVAPKLKIKNKEKFSNAFNTGFKMLLMVATEDPVVKRAFRPLMQKHFAFDIGTFHELIIKILNKVGQRSEAREKTISLIDEELLKGAFAQAKKEGIKYPNQIRFSVDKEVFFTLMRPVRRINQWQSDTINAKTVGYKVQRAILAGLISGGFMHLLNNGEAEENAQEGDFIEQNMSLFFGVCIFILFLGV